MFIGIIRRLSTCSSRNSFVFSILHAMRMRYYFSSVYSGASQFVCVSVRVCVRAKTEKKLLTRN